MIIRRQGNSMSLHKTEAATDICIGGNFQLQQFDQFFI